jgi:hypothetical protein
MGLHQHYFNKKMVMTRSMLARERARSDIAQKRPQVRRPSPWAMLKMASMVIMAVGLVMVAMPKRYGQRRVE